MIANIVLYGVDPHSGWASKAVALGEIVASIGHGPLQFSHVALTDKRPGWEIQAKFPRVCRSPIEVRRRPLIVPIPGITHDQRLIMWATANAHIGDHYNMIGLLTAGLIGGPHSEVCSQLVDVAARAADIVIPREGARLLSPNAIADFLGIGKKR